MLIPSIDIINNDAVQLVGGEEMALNAGSPGKIAATFGLLGPIAVIDLDAAMGNGENTETIKALCQKYRCRVGGGIRSIEKALEWLDAGAEHIIIGTAATPEFLSQPPKADSLQPSMPNMVKSSSKAGRPKQAKPLSTK